MIIRVVATILLIFPHLAAVGAESDPVDSSPAIRMLLDRSEQGDLDARFELGQAYQNGRHNIDPDPVSAAQWYRSAARAGHMKSQRHIGLMLLFGSGIPQSYEQAQHWLYLSANKGDTESQFHLSLLYLSGRGVAQDVPTGRRWLEASAKADYAPAQSELGLQLIRGELFEPEHKEGLKWLRKATRQHHPEALHLMGELQIEGKHLSRNEDRARGYFKRAAELGHPASQVWMAQWEERQSPPNYLNAMRLYRAAAEKGDSAGHLGVAKLEIESKTPSPNVRSGLESLDAAVKQNYPEAMFYMAELVSAGVLPGGIKRTVGLMEQAGILGHLESQYQLGIHYYNGQTTSRDIRKAAYWWKRAARSGHAAAQYAYGLMHLQGIGMQKNEGVGYALINVAAAQGYADAVAIRNNLRQTMSATLLRSAQQLSVDLYQRYVDSEAGDDVLDALQ